MRAFRRGSVAKRIAINLIATVALLLQSLVAISAKPVELSDPAICFQNGSQQDGPADDHAGGHGLCCILACAACGIVYVASIAGIAAFPERPARRLGFVPAAPIPASAPLEFYFAARGPPSAL